MNLLEKEELKEIKIQLFLKIVVLFYDFFNGNSLFPYIKALTIKIFNWFQCEKTYNVSMSICENIILCQSDGHIPY